MLTSLELFNQHGEASVTSVDIALELDISPGNLYYHFKGKEVIVLALFDMYRQQLKRLLAAPDHQFTLEEFFYFLYLLLDAIATFRFLYRNPADLMEKYPELARSFKALIQNMEDALLALLSQFQGSGSLTLAAQQLPLLAEQLGLVFSQAANYYLLKGQSVDSTTFSQKTLMVLLFLLKPHMDAGQAQLAELEHWIQAGQFGQPSGSDAE
nr:TetR/AcrR family transcriptional regulator [Bowmanella dokdonensis]